MTVYFNPTSTQNTITPYRFVAAIVIAAGRLKRGIRFEADYDLAEPFCLDGKENVDLIISTIKEELVWVEKITGKYAKS